MKSNVLSIDVGGTNQRIAVIDRQGNILKKICFKNPEKNSGEAFLECLFEKIEETSKGADICGASFALPIVYDKKSKKIYDAPNLPFLVGMDIEVSFKNLTPLPYWVENDANCAVLGEYWKGAGEKLSSLACFTFGTGVGGGLVLDGKLWTGNRGMASEMGHMKIDDTQKSPCSCGDFGCLEAFVSANAIKHKFKKEPKALFLSAQKGDKESIEVFRFIGEKLGRGIASIANILNIEDFVVGGRISNAFEYFYPEALRVAKKCAMKGPAENIRIFPAKLGDNAGLVGAAYLFYQSQQRGHKQ